MRSPYRAYKEILLLIFCLLIGCALPALIALIFGQGDSADDKLSDRRELLFYCHDAEEGESTALTLRELLIGTLAAYNPSDTPPESLKAQAVALRSRAYCLVGYCRSEEDTLCDSPSHGFAYADADKLASIWGENEANARREAAATAVDAVGNEVLCYEDSYALALTHSASDGKTKAMDGYPYLASVTTPEASVTDESKAESEEQGESGYGLSRAGASLYAKQGLSYREILLHYFPGTELSVI